MEEKIRRHQNLVKPFRVQIFSFKPKHEITVKVIDVHKLESKIDSISFSKN